MTALASEVDVTAALIGAGGSVLAAAPRRATPAPIASPSYRALESASVLVEGPDGTLFFKLMHPEMRGWFDLASGAAVAVAAGAAGVGPRVIRADDGLLLTEALEEGWRTATLDRLQEPAVVAGTMTALRRLHSLPATGARFDAFARIDSYVAEARQARVPLPHDLGWILALLDAARPVLLAAPLAVCRNDGSASNLMLGPGGAVMLVDFDRGGMNDPMFDLGVLLAEITDFEADMHAPFLAYAGNWDAAAFARARLWAVVDDVMHMLWMRLCAARSARTSLEWLKYGEWRLMRARLALHHPQFEEKLRVAGGQA